MSNKDDPMHQWIKLYAKKIQPPDYVWTDTLQNFHDLFDKIVTWSNEKKQIPSMKEDADEYILLFTFLKSKLQNETIIMDSDFLKVVVISLQKVWKHFLRSLW